MGTTECGGARKSGVQKVGRWGLNPLSSQLREGPELQADLKRWHRRTEKQAWNWLTAHRSPVQGQLSKAAYGPWGLPGKAPLLSRAAGGVSRGRELGSSAPGRGGRRAGAGQVAQEAR